MIRRQIASVFVALSLLMVGGDALAQTKKPAKKPATLQESLAEPANVQAKADYDAAIVFAGNNDFASAETRMQSAYDRTRDPRILYNIAVVQKKGARYTRALATLELYLAAATPAEPRISDRDRLDGENFKKDLLLVTAPLSLDVVEVVEGKEVPVEGAVVTVDSEEIGRSPLPVKTVLNQRSGQVLRVVKDAFQPYEQKINVNNPAGHQEHVVLVRVPTTGTLEVVLGAPYEVQVDGASKGVTTSWAGPLTAGPHTLRVTAEGKKPYVASVDISQGKSKRIELSTLESARSYKWLYIVGGAAVLATVGGVVAYKAATQEVVYTAPSGSLGSANP